MNMLALNVANELITGKRSVDDARRFMVQVAQDLARGRRSPYTEELLFLPGRREIPVRETGLREIREIREVPVVPAGIRTIDVIARDGAFSPAEIVVAPGEHVRLKLINEGKKKHSID